MPEPLTKGDDRAAATNAVIWLCATNVDRLTYLRQHQQDRHRVRDDDDLAVEMSAETSQGIIGAAIANSADDRRRGGRDARSSSTCG